jgi:ABC-type multidrug transport system fused ATPase/permease subunit
MTAFWRLAKHLLHERAALFWAMVFALLSAGGLAVGLLSIGPLLKIILDADDPKSLAQLTAARNASGAFPTVPQWMVDVLPTTPFGSILLLLGTVAFFTIAGGIANFLHQYLSQTVVARAIARIRAEAFDRVVHMPLGRVMVRGPSEFIARIIRDTAELQRGLIALVSKAVTSVLKGVAAGLVAIIIEWQLVLIAVPTAIVMAIILRKLGKRIRRGTRGSLRAQEQLLRVATESLQGLRAVKASTAEDEIIERFDVQNDDAVRNELRVRTARALSAPVVESLATFVLLVLALFAVREILQGDLPLADFTLSLGALAMAGASLRPLTGLVNEVQAASAPAQRINDVLVEPIEGDAATGKTPSQPTTGDRASRPQAPRHVRSIEFDHVTFTYPGAEQPSLRGVSLNILHGEKIAIVGPNGCGKTTLVSLLPRLLVPDAGGGRVIIDGHDVAEFDLRSLRRQIGVVTQETVLFRGSIASNIAFGMPDATRERIIDAARRAHADEFIRQIPNGYDADVAEQGASLSGGQRQRLAIARAIMRDPSILILDEATSQIDAESEMHINAALREFGRGRTALVIAHRLSTVLHADRIVVMEGGAIIDVGRHDQLLERCELYRRLSKTQLVAVESAD